MNQVIDELKEIQGVIGSVLYSAKQGVIATNLPSLFKVERLAEMGKVLVKIFSTGRMHFSDTNEVSLHYDESVVVVREVGNKLYLFVICDPSFNLSLLTMSLNLIEGELRDMGDDAGTVTLMDNPMTTSPQPLQTVDQMMSGPLADLLGEMQRDLARIVGPMARIIFEESLERWGQAVNPGKKTLPPLLEFLGEAIGDSEKSTEYSKLIAPVLERAGVQGV